MKNENNEGLNEQEIGSEKVFSGTLLHVYKDVVRLPDGKETVREWVDHPGAAAIIPLFDDQTTLLVEQYRYPVRRVMLEVPAGKRDGNEPFLDTARRELDEETGWLANSIHDLGFSYPVIGYSNEVIHFFLATDLVPGVAEQEEDEFLRIQRVPFEDALNLVYDGTIQDMKSIVGLHRVNQFLHNGQG